MVLRWYDALHEGLARWLSQYYMKPRVALVRVRAR